MVHGQNLIHFEPKLPETYPTDLFVLFVNYCSVPCIAAELFSTISNWNTISWLWSVEEDNILSASF